MKTKKYVIESEGFKNGIGSNNYAKKRQERLEEIKRQLAELEKQK